jgi:hypothetical protein
MVRINEDFERLKRKNFVLVIAFLLLILFTFLVSCLAVLYFNIARDSSTTSTFYQKQAIQLCKMSNIYRNITILQDPNIVGDIAPEINCNQILYLEK